MLSLTAFNRRFTPNWVFISTLIVIIGLFLRLGFWQLSRASEKKIIIAQQHERAKAPFKSWDNSKKIPQSFQNITISGTFLPHLFFLDNQHQNHQYGFHVISPFLMHDDKIVLIDRGWVPGDVTRRVLPKIDTPSQPLKLSGSAYYPSSKSFFLGPLIEPKGDKQAIIELLDVKTIRQFLHKPVYPFIIRLDAANQYGFVRKWPVVSMSPQRHYGYAFQWFAMAFVLLVILIAFSFKKIEVGK